MNIQDLIVRSSSPGNFRHYIDPIRLFIFLVMMMSAAGASAQKCQTIPLSSSLQSLYWPVFLERQLLAIDYAGNQAVKIEISGDHIGNVERLGMAQDRPFVALAQNGNEIVQVFGDGKGLQIGWYDQQLKLKKHLSFGAEDMKEQLAFGSRQRDRRRLLAPYSWIAIQGHLVGYGAVSTDRTGEDYELGFFDQPLPSQGSKRIPQANLFHTFSNPSFYRIGNPLIVGIGSEIYFLEIGNYADLYRFDLALGLPSELIEGLPGSNTLLKDPKTHTLSLSDRNVLMERLDEYEGPSALYEQQGTLYLLTRSLNGSTPEWRLRRLEIDDNNQINEAIAVGTPLPSRAPQLVLVPTSTPEKWLIFEQEKTFDGSRRISTMMTCQVPTSRGRVASGN